MSIRKVEKWRREPVFEDFELEVSSFAVSENFIHYKPYDDENVKFLWLNINAVDVCVADEDLSEFGFICIDDENRRWLRI